MRIVYCMLCLWVVACTQNQRKLKEEPPKTTKHLDADPMEFIIIYQKEIDEILQAKDDCEATLSNLLRFVAEHRKEFIERMKSKQDNKHLEQLPENEPSVRSLMKFADICPQQLSRFNQGLHGLVE